MSNATLGDGTNTGDVTASSNLTDDAVVVGDGGAKGIKTLASLGTSGQVLTSNGAGTPPSFQDASGDVAGPVSSTDNALARWDGTNGDTLQDSTVIVDDNGIVTNSSQPAFQAWLDTNRTNVTGDNTQYTIIFDQEAFDNNSDFNLGTSTLTAPVNSTWVLQGSVAYDEGGSGATNGSITINTSNRVYRLTRMTTSSEVSAVPFYNGSVVAEMDAADTADLRIDLNGGTLNADVIGDTSGEANTYFSGYQVG